MTESSSDQHPILRNLTLWIGILFLLLFVLNGVFFTIYRQSHTDESLSIQVWNYLESNVFQGLTSSLVAPIILFFLESRLKFLESFEENRKKQRELAENELQVKIQEASERKRKEEEEQKEKRRNLQELVQSHFIQFEESISSLWHRFYNILYMDGKSVMDLSEKENSKKEKGYFVYTTLYPLACLLAYMRIFLVDGIYGKIDLCSPDLDDIIKNKLNEISSHLDDLGDILQSSFFRYHQLSLAESVMIRENNHYRVTTYLEFRKQQNDQQSLEYQLVEQSRNFIRKLGEYDKKQSKYEEMEIILLLTMENLADIAKELDRRKFVIMSIGKKKDQHAIERLRYLKSPH